MDPYRHSVWIDVFGVILFGLVLLGGAGYLVSNMGSLTGGSDGGGTAIASGGASPAPHAKLGFRERRSAPASRSPSIIGEGPPIASRRSPSGMESNSARTRSEGSAWRSEARKLSGRARALSNQLGQMERAASKEQAQSSREALTAETSDGRREASTTSNPGTPEDSDQVPIDDHLHWLLMAGVLWGIWRLS